MAHRASVSSNSGVTNSNKNKQPAAAAVPSKIGGIAAKSTTRQQDSEDDDDDEDDEDDDDDENEEKSVRMGSKSALPVKVNSKDLDWSLEEQQTIMKFYGLETLFPTVWGEDHSLQPAALKESTNVQDDKDVAIQAALQGEDASDPLKIKGKIRRPRGTMQRGGEAVSIIISDKNYSAKTFLLEVHRGSDFKDLEQGGQKLKQSISERNETTKGLIKKHFAKFVNAKTTIDSFYKEMRHKNLISREDYGIAPFLHELNGLEKEANALYGPVLDRRAKADKIRITLSILEQWKFFFNLATSLTEMIRRGRYDAAVRDYKKGKNIMQSSFTAEDSAKDAPKTLDRFGKDSSNLLPKNYQNVFEKLWVEVERVVALFRDELFKSLRVMTNPIETQEKLIAYLVDLDSKRDPVWCYLDTQYNWVLDNLVKVYNRYITGMKDVVKELKRSGEKLKDDSKDTAGKDTKLSYENLASNDYLNMITSEGVNTDNLLMEDVRPSVPWSMNDIKKALMCVTPAAFEAQFGQEILVCFWKENLRFVLELCQVLSSHLPAFWRTCKMYMDGTGNKTEHSKRANAQKRSRDGQAMMTNIFEIIQMIINYSFFLNVEAGDVDDEMEEDENDDDEEEGEVMLKGNESKKDDGPIVPLLKDLSAYGSMGGMDANDNNDSDIVWQTYTRVSSSLEKLNPSTYATHMQAHPLILVQYSTQIMHALNECIDCIKPDYHGQEGIAVLRSLEATIDTVRGCLVNRICDGWVGVFRQFHEFEDWSFENHNPSTSSSLISKGKFDSTFLMKISYKMSKFILRCLTIIVFGARYDPTGSTFELLAPSFATHVEKIKESVISAFFGLLDGFEWQVGQWRDPDSQVHYENISGWLPEIHHNKLKTVVPEQKARFGQFVPPECSNFVENIKPKDFRNVDARSFMTLSNLDYMNFFLLPSISELLTAKFATDITQESKYLTEISGMLESIIIMNYARRENSHLRNMVKQAVFYSGLDWASHQAPKEIRSYSFQILHHLVCIHASVSSVSRNLVEKVFSQILVFLATELLVAFREVDRFNIPGMLQATLEIEFLDATLKAFETPLSETLFTQLYETFERATDPEDKVDPTTMGGYLQAVKGYLSAAKAAGATQFRCFSAEGGPIVE